MRELFALTVVTLLAASISACGGAGGVADSANVTVRSAIQASDATDRGQPSANRAGGGSVSPGRDRDGDYDNPGGGYYDGDDAEILTYGRAGDARDRTEIATLVRRYYEVAAVGDGAAGCALVYALVDESITEEYRQSYRFGSTCAQAMSAQFVRNHASLIAGLTRLRVVGARVGSERGYALLSAGARPERYQLVHREAGAWSIQALVDSTLP